MSAGLSKKRFPCKTLGHFRLSAEHFVRKTSLLTGLDNYLEIFKLNVRSGVVQKNRTKFNALSFCNRSSYNQRSKCSAKITVYQITQKFCQWVKYSLISSRKWTGSQTFKYSILDAVPPIHAESSHVATDKVPSK